MEKIKTLLIANRGEVAVRLNQSVRFVLDALKLRVRCIIKIAKSLDIKTVSIYSEADAASRHVSLADEAVQWPGSNATAYTDDEAILKIAIDKKADAVIPGYGFLSENADFDAIKAFGIKHIARGLAEKAGVPIVPCTKGLVESEEDAVKEVEKLNVPFMLKATGGGGGMGLVTCISAEEVKEGFKMVLSDVLNEQRFIFGDTLTRFLKSFDCQPSVIDIISCGAYTLVQDLPGRPIVGKGIPHSGPMDPMSFQIANILVGNAQVKMPGDEPSRSKKGIV